MQPKRGKKKGRPRDKRHITHKINVNLVSGFTQVQCHVINQLTKFYNTFTFFFMGKIVWFFSVCLRGEKKKQGRNVGEEGFKRLSVQEEGAQNYTNPNQKTTHNIL